MAGGVDQNWLDRKELRYKLRSSLRRITSLKGLRTCGAPLDNAVTIRSIGNTYYYTDIASCGSAWACPVCASKIRAHRANEVSRAVVAALAKGWSVLFVTRTLPHSTEDKLAMTLGLLAEGRRYVFNQTVVKAARQAAGFVGEISAKEITYGRQGYHPHSHDFEFFDRDMSLESFATLSRLYYDYLDRFYSQNGFSGLSRERGVVVEHVQFGEDALARYLTKMQSGTDIRLIAAHELARSDLKHGRTGSLMPFEIAQAFFDTGDTELLDLWREYEQSTFRRSAVRFKRGLRAQLLPGEADETDPQVARRKVQGTDAVKFVSRLY